MKDACDSPVDGSIHWLRSLRHQRIGPPDPVVTGILAKLRNSLRRQPLHSRPTRRCEALLTARALERASDRRTDEGGGASAPPPWLVEADQHQARGISVSICSTVTAPV